MGWPSGKRTRGGREPDETKTRARKALVKQFTSPKKERAVGSFCGRRVAGQERGGRNRRLAFQKTRRQRKKGVRLAWGRKCRKNRLDNGGFKRTSLYLGV